MVVENGIFRREVEPFLAPDKFLPMEEIDPYALEESACLTPNRKGFKSPTFLPTDSRGNIRRISAYKDEVKSPLSLTRGRLGLMRSFGGEVNDFSELSIDKPDPLWAGGPEPEWDSLERVNTDPKPKHTTEQYLLERMKGCYEPFGPVVDVFQVPYVEFQPSDGFPFGGIKVEYRPRIYLNAPEQLVKKARWDMFNNWQEGGQNVVDRLRGIDLSGEFHVLSLSEIASSIGLIRPYVNYARNGLNVGSSVDQERGIWGFTTYELLQVMVGSCALLVAVLNEQREQQKPQSRI